MRLGRVSNPRPLAYESDGLLTALRSPAKLNKYPKYDAYQILLDGARDIRQNHWTL